MQGREVPFPAKYELPDKAHNPKTEAEAPTAVAAATIRSASMQAGDGAGIWGQRRVPWGGKHARGGACAD